jgi:zinc transport system permease protein
MLQPEALEAAPTWADFAAGWDLYRDPVVCALVAGLALGFLSGYVVLRRMVFVSAVTTQSAGLGVALTFYTHIQFGLTLLSPSMGAAALALGAAWLLVLDPRRLGLSREALLGVVFAATGGAAIAVGAKISQEAHQIDDILFGTAVMVDSADLWRVLVVGAAILVLHVWWFRGFAFASFDPVAAAVQRVPVRLLDGILFASIGLMVGVSTQALGALPVFALSTTPAIAALLLLRTRLLITFLVAAAVGGASGVLGYLLAFFGELPVGACQTVVAAAFVALAAVVRGGINLAHGRR